jgi:hypothetical protein
MTENLPAQVRSETACKQFKAIRLGRNFMPWHALLELITLCQTTEDSCFKNNNRKLENGTSLTGKYFLQDHQVRRKGRLS